jgi:hypothetical protein
MGKLRLGEQSGEFEKERSIAAQSWIKIANGAKSALAQLISSNLLFLRKAISIRKISRIPKKC